MFKRLLSSLISALPKSIKKTANAAVAAESVPSDAFVLEVQALDVEEKRCIFAYFRMLNILHGIRNDLRRKVKTRWDIADICRIYAGVESHYIAYGYRPMLPNANDWHHVDADIVELKRRGYLQKMAVGETAPIYASAYRRNIERLALTLEKQSSALN
jgi:hypothetical protein